MDRRDPKTKLRPNPRKEEEAMMTSLRCRSLAAVAFAFASFGCDPQAGKPGGPHQPSPIDGTGGGGSSTTGSGTGATGSSTAGDTSASGNTTTGSSQTSTASGTGGANASKPTKTVLLIPRTASTG